MGHLEILLLDPPGPVAACTALDGIDLDARYQPQGIPSLLTHALHPAVAGYVIRNPAQRLGEIGPQQAVLVRQDEILEGIAHGLGHLPNHLVVGKEPGQPRLPSCHAG